MKKFILLLLSFCALSAFAASPPTTHWAYQQPGAWFPSYAAACDAWYTWRAAMETDPKVSLVFRNASDNSCSAERIHVNYGSYGFAGASLIKQVRCPDGYTLENGLCEPPDPGDTQCQQGAAEVSTLNVTLGWARSPLPNKQDQIGEVRNPSNVCAPGPTEGSSCRFKVLDNSNQFRSQTPSSQGLYRISGDFTVIQTDQPCGPDDDAESANPDTPDKACPGSVGELNGKPVCAIDPGTGGIDPVGKPGVGNQTDDKGNPSAGKKPSSGEGSGEGGVGRTPTAGSGGNAGGPASAANGGTGTKPGTSGPDGTTNKPEEGKEQAACGAPGQPKCRIDESGTPSGQGDFDAANRGVDETREGWLAEITKAQELQVDGWTWTFQLPSGCTPLELPAFNMSLDVCRFQPVIHDIMSMVWLICTVMGCVWMVFNAQKN